MAAFGVPAQQLAEDRQRRGAGHDERPIGVAPQLWPAVRLFDGLSRTQWLWLTGANGAAHRVGLRYEALPVVMRLLGLRARPRLLQRLQVMEAEALIAFSDAAGATRA